jgi:general secretion pathway protein A
MYLSRFGLKCEPFSMAPDPRFLFMNDRHREALAHLVYGLDAGGGFVLLTGEIGAGKTTVCRCFLEQVPAGCHIAYIFNPKLNVIELLQSVCDEFGIAVAPAMSGAPTVKDHLDPLNRFLLQAHARGERCVLVIDEAQNLSADVLEQLRLLTNLETAERKLLQIILIGQPELRTLLAGPELEQLAQRVIARYHLGPLTAAETTAYVAHRLSVAGLDAALPFDASALRRIHRLTGGVPRRINLLCDRALLGAYAEGRDRVDRRILDRAAGEVFDASVTAGSALPRRRWALAGAAVAGGLAVLATAALVGRPGGSGPSAPREAALASAAPVSQPAAPTPAAGTPAAVPAASAANAVALASVAAGPIDAAQASTPVVPAASSVPAAAAASSAAAAFSVADLATLPRDEREPWRELASAWSVTLAPGDPCAVAVRQSLHCYRTSGATLALLQQFDRPGLITLADAQGHARHARLVALDRGRATLAAGAQQWTLSLEQLAGLWRGEFATFWRAPEGYAAPLVEGSSGPAVQALAAALASDRHEPAPAPNAVFDAALRSRLAAFQLAQGLKPDGVAGPGTFMMLNRRAGVAEPRLAAP